MSPRIDRARHLAVYTAFHRSAGNKLLHGVFVPTILFSAMCLQAYLRVPTDHPLGCLLHLGTLLSLALFAVLSTIDRLGALLLLAWLLPASALAGHLASTVPWLVLVPTAALVHVLSWWFTVKVGHEVVEPELQLEGGAEDSNVYFRRGYYLARDLGCAVSPLDRVIQFCIAPLSVVQDGLALFGLRLRLERAIERERARVLARLSRGGSPLITGAPS